MGASSKTNNTAELSATAHAMIWIILNTKEGAKIKMRYDSKYAEGMIKP